MAEDDDDFVESIRKLTLQKTTSLEARITKMQSIIDSLETERDSLVIEKNSLMTEMDSLAIEKNSLMAERDSLVDDVSSMADRIAELEAREADANTRRESGIGGDPADDPDVSNTNLPLLDIPEWRIRHITSRIATGERITVYNMMYIDMYSKDDRFTHAIRFRTRIVNAFKKMCLRFAHEHGIPSEVHDIPTDFEVIKIKLHELATLNQRAFIRLMFRSNE